MQHLYRAQASCTRSFLYLNVVKSFFFFRSWSQKGRKGFSRTIFAVIQSVPGQNTVEARDSLLRPVCYCEHPSRHRVSCGTDCPPATTTRAPWPWRTLAPTLYPPPTPITLSPTGETFVNIGCAGFEILTSLQCPEPVKPIGSDFGGPDIQG